MSIEERIAQLEERVRALEEIQSRTLTLSDDALQVIKEMHSKKPPEIPFPGMTLEESEEMKRRWGRRMNERP